MDITTVTLTNPILYESLLLVCNLYLFLSLMIRSLQINSYHIVTHNQGTGSQKKLLLLWSLSKLRDSAYALYWRQAE